MAWYNINSSDGIAKEFDKKNRIPNIIVTIEAPKKDESISL